MSTENDTGRRAAPGGATGSEGASGVMFGRLMGPHASFGSSPPELLWMYWPRLDYASGLALQHRLHDARRRSKIPDVLMVTEHHATVTLGRGGSLVDLPMGGTELARRGIALYRVGRGGRATFHGPGQLVAYPIMDLRALRIGPRRFVETIEGAAARVLKSIGVDAESSNLMAGLWVRGRKIASVGLEILGGVTRHGLSLNLRREFGPLDCIIPCGVAGLQSTSVEAQGILPPPTVEVGAALAREMGTMLGLHPSEVDGTTLLRDAGTQSEGAE